MIKELFYDFSGYNKELFFYINKILSGDVTQAILSNLSNLFYYYNFIIYFAIAAFYFIKKIKQDEKRFDYYFHLLVRYGMIYCWFMFVFTFFKYTVNMPRPLCSFPPDSFHSIIHPDSVRCLSSFPSAHSGFALIISYMLWNYIALDFVQKLVIISIVILTGLARIAMAMHFPADVLYGYVIGVLVIILGNLSYDKLPKSILDIFRKIFMFLI
jgi:membrane-associated phospholipid phosphatase